MKANWRVLNGAQCNGFGYPVMLLEKFGVLLGLEINR